MELEKGDFVLHPVFCTERLAVGIKLADDVADAERAEDVPVFFRIIKFDATLNSGRGYEIADELLVNGDVCLEIVLRMLAQECFERLVLVGRSRLSASKPSAPVVFISWHGKSKLKLYLQRYALKFVAQLYVRNHKTITTMGLFGSIAGGVLGIGGSIFGGLSASNAMKKVQENIENQQRENQDWYDRRYNEDSTQRADAQRILTMTQESIKNRNRQAAGTAAVMGGTEESVAAARAANNQAISDATSKIAVAGDARKDNIEQQYMQTKANLNDKLNNLQMQKAQNVAQATQGVAQAGSQMAGLF